MCCVGLTAFVTSCSEPDDEIKNSVYDRLFSPTAVEARVQNKTNVSLKWTDVRGAASYAIELFANDSLTFAGSPVETYNDVTDNAYVIVGLMGETQYSARVKAIGDNIAESKWTGVFFETDKEQILYAVDPNDMEATQVTLRWPAGQTATSIVLTPGNITYAVTAQDVAAGAATITGLTGETEYTAVLKNGEKVRGTISFTTPLDLGGAIAVKPESDLAALIADAAEGDVFALFPGEYTVPTLSIAKTISIKGVRPGERPVLKTTIFRVKSGSGLELRDLILDGEGSDGNQAIVYDDDLADGVYNALTIENCLIKNYTKGTLYVNKKCNIVSVTIKNNIYANIECDGGDFIDFRNGIAQTFEFTNNTVYNSALGRDFFRMDAGGSNNFPEVNSIINISNNTFNKVSDNSGKRILYIRLKTHEITFNKNILANTAGYYTNQDATTIKEMEKNNYFNAPNFTGSTQSKAQNDAGTYTQLDPGFKDADKGDFTLSNEDLKYNQIGDQRWW